MSSFYVTLPSSVLSYAENKQSDFTTILGKTLELEGDWEVALNEISFSPEFSSSLGTLYIRGFLNRLDFYYPIHNEHYNIDLGNYQEESCQETFININKRIFEFITTTENRRRHDIFTNPSNFQLEAFELKYNELEKKSYETHYKKRVEELQKYIKLRDKSVKNEVDTLLKTQWPGQKALYEAEIGRLKKSKLFTLYIFAETDEIYDYYFLPSKSDRFRDCLQNVQDWKYYPRMGYRIPKQELTSLVNVEKYYVFTTDFLNNNHFEYLLPKASEVLTKVQQDKLRQSLEYFKYEDGNIINVDHVQSNAEIEGRINVFFNMAHGRTFLNSKKYSFPSFLHFIKYIAIYTDCISPQLFGDSFTQCLMVISVQNSNDGVINRYESPFYVPVCKNKISDINIAIKDLEGNPIRFSNPFSQVIVKLHFKKKRE